MEGFSKFHKLYSARQLHCRDAENVEAKFPLGGSIRPSDSEGIGPDKREGANVGTGTLVYRLTSRLQSSVGGRWASDLRSWLEKEASAEGHCTYLEFQRGNFLIENPSQQEVEAQMRATSGGSQREPRERPCPQEGRLSSPGCCCCVRLLLRSGTMNFTSSDQQWSQSSQEMNVQK